MSRGKWLHPDGSDERLYAKRRQVMMELDRLCTEVYQAKGWRRPATLPDPRKQREE